MFKLTSVNMIHVVRHLALARIASHRQRLIGCMLKVRKAFASLENKETFLGE